MSEPLLSQTLRHTLSDWTDVDVASYFVAVALGVAPDPQNKWNYWGAKKWLFWTANPLGDGMYGVLEMLTQVGVLEKDDDETKFRWNPGFDWEEYGEEQAKA